mmetsp:Transcript_25201/g.60197  ORF Transcript_25201/g.60197 Transcript_25201/m.60197 type:complete len:470 (-) Transcript_25201:1161-2570(-)
MLDAPPHVSRRAVWEYGRYCHTKAGLFKTRLEAWTHSSPLSVQGRDLAAHARVVLHQVRNQILEDFLLMVVRVLPRVLPVAVLAQHAEEVGPDNLEVVLVDLLPLDRLRNPWKDVRDLVDGHGLLLPEVMERLVLDVLGSHGLEVLDAVGQHLLLLLQHFQLLLVDVELDFRVREVLVQKLEGVEKRLAVELPRVAVQHRRYLGHKCRHVVADRVWLLLATLLRRGLPLFERETVCVHQNTDEHVPEHQERDEHPRDEEHLPHVDVDVPEVGVPNRRPEVDVPEQRLPKRLDRVDNGDEIARLFAEVEVPQHCEATQDDAENEHEMVQVHHRRPHRLVHDLKARLELVVLEEAQNAEKDRHEVHRQLVLRVLVHLFENPLVVVDRDLNIPLDNFAEDHDAHVDEEDVARVVDRVQNVERRPTLEEVSGHGVFDLLSDKRGHQDEHPNHENNLKGQPHEVDFLEIGLHIE